LYIFALHYNFVRYECAMDFCQRKVEILVAVQFFPKKNNNIAQLQTYFAAGKYCHHSRGKKTRSSAAAEGPRDATHF